MNNRRTLLGSSSSTIKSHNLRAILLTLLRRESISRVHLAQLTGLSTTTITNLISELLAEGIVIEIGAEKREPSQGAGRPRTGLQLVPEARYAIGVHIGIGAVYVTVTDLRAHPVIELSLDFEVGQPPEKVLPRMVDLVQEAIETSGVNPAHIVGIGVGASGLVDPYEGVNVIAPTLGWRDVPIRDWLSQRLGLPVTVDNNVRAMALGEAMFGPEQDVYVLAFVYARIGLAAGFVVGGQLYRGAGAGAGEIGHTTIIPNGGEHCRCGNTGCLETLFSEPVIVRLAHEIATKNPRGKLAQHLRRAETLDTVFDAARNGDESTLDMLRERARYMGIALANLVNTLNPELIVFGGIFEQGADLLLPTVEATMRERAFADLGERVRLKTTSFSKRPGIIGAAALALNAFFYQNSDVLPRKTVAHRSDEVWN
ncbi:MAG: ROK family transcriptional regulator [Burkholderiales bacterium]|nr:ROK family transcriptional regulator [Anaerolineae bacterium]